MVVLLLRVYFNFYQHESNINSTFPVLQSVSTTLLFRFWWKTKRLSSDENGGDILPSETNRQLINKEGGESLLSSRKKVTKFYLRILPLPIYCSNMFSVKLQKENYSSVFNTILKTYYNWSAIFLFCTASEELQWQCKC